MATFKKHKFGTKGDYQITVTGTRDDMKAIITKFVSEKTWTIAFYNPNENKPDLTCNGYKQLTHVKNEAIAHVDYMERY